MDSKLIPGLIFTGFGIFGFFFSRFLVKYQNSDIDDEKSLIKKRSRFKIVSTALFVYGVIRVLSSIL